MSSTDRAPEPTMEEILASIRRIISEEENNDAPDTTAAAEDEEYDYGPPPAQVRQAAPADETAEAASEQETSEQDSPQPEADAEFAEEPVEELTVAIEPEENASDEEILELGDLTGGAPEEAAPEQPAPEEQVAQQPTAQEAVAQESVPQEPAAQEPAPQEPAAEEPVAGEAAAGEEPLELSEDFNFAFEEEEHDDAGEALVRETSALEAAIAALKGDQARAAASQGSEPERDSAARDEEFEEPSLENVLQEASAEDEDADIGSVETYDSEDDEGLAEDAAAFPGAYHAERRNGTGHRETADFGYVASGGPLEETVKDMLRPMLREWLDQNMDRLLQEALHEELQAGTKHPRN
ncbi:MAG: DUF2497 domain-containing protein [Methyloligella sp. ZOD6]